jgi:hypothetical protein
MAEQQYSVRLNVAIVVGAMAAGMLYALIMGEDVNWDWQNYHEYNAWAALRDRYDVDVVPAGFQTYFNPLVYFPVYYLRHFLPAPVAGLIMGALHGLNLVLIYALVRVASADGTRFWLIPAAILIAAVGPMTLSEIGTSFADILTALLVVAGVIAILSTEKAPPPYAILGGLLIGAAVGLKLTNVVYALGAVAAVLAAPRPALALVYLALGGAVGAAVTGGAWSLLLWREFGNPIFPLFNGVFNGRELQPLNILDLQFVPRSIADALAYPFYWLLGEHRSSEYPFRDARFAVVVLLIPVAIAARVVRRGPPFTRSDVQLFLMFGVSYFAWLGLFAIQRYAVTLELLCAPVIVLLVMRITQGFAPVASYGGAISAAIAVAIALWSQPWDWGHRPWSRPYRPQISDQLTQPATYFILAKPLAYVAPQLAPGSRFYQLADIALPIQSGGRFDRRIRDGLNDQLPGGIWELHASGGPREASLLETYSLAVDATKPCVAIEGAVMGSAIEACPLVKATRISSMPSKP